MFSQTEYCLLCSSKNKLLVDLTDHAWECWNCNACYWIDDQARLEFMVHNDLSLKLAEEALHFRYNNAARDPKDKYVLNVKPIEINFCMIESNE